MKSLLRRIPTPIQAPAVAALLRRKGALVVVTILGGAIAIAFFGSGRSNLVAGFILALVLGHGIVSRDFARGTVLLWLQKPHSPTLFYVARLTEAAFVLWGAHLVMDLLALALAPHSTLPSAVLSQLPVGLALDASALAVVFGCSAFGIEPDLLPALVVIILLGWLGAEATVAPVAVGRWAPFLAAQRFPVLEIDALNSWLGHSGAFPGSAVLRLLGYPTAWVLLGALAVHLRSLRPPLSSTES